jgi:hypothetical protein
MRKNKALFMWGALAVVAAAGAIFDHQWDRRQAAQKSESDKILKVESSQIYAFEVSGKSFAVSHDGVAAMTNKIRIEKNAEGWWIRSPVAELADQNQAQGFVEGLVHERATEVATSAGPDRATNDSKVEWEQFGLEKPQGEVQIFEVNGTSSIISVGARKNFQGDAYLRRGEESKVFLGTSSWFTRVEKNLLDFREKRILQAPSMKLKGASFIEGKNRLSFVLKDATWFSPEHPDWKLDQTKVREVLALLVGPVISNYINTGKTSEAELKANGVLPGALRIEATLEGEEELWTADIAKANQASHAVWVANPPMLVMANGSEVGGFFGMEAKNFRDLKSPFEFDQAKVAKIEVQRGVDFFRAQKNETGWQVIEKSNPDFQMKPESLVNLVKQLRDLEADQFIALSKTAKPEASTEVKLSDAGGATMLQLSLGEIVKLNGQMGTVSLVGQTNLMNEAFALEQGKVQELGITSFLPKQLREPPPVPAIPDMPKTPASPEGEL